MKFKTIPIIFLILVVLTASIRLTNRDDDALCGENVSCGIDYDCCFLAKHKSYSCSMKDPEERCAYVPIGYTHIDPVCDLNKPCPEGKKCCYKPKNSSSNYSVKCIETSKKCSDDGFVDPANTQKMKGKIGKVLLKVSLANIFGRVVKKQLKENERNDKYDDVTCSENKTCGNTNYDCCRDSKYNSASCQLIDNSEKNPHCSYGYQGFNYTVVEPVCSTTKICSNGDVCCYHYDKDDADKKHPHYVKCAKKCTGNWIPAVAPQTSLTAPKKAISNKLAPAKGDA
jgi:hypothetical protein